MNKLKNSFKGFAWGLMVCAILTMCSSCGTTSKFVDITEDMFIHDTTFIQKVRVDTFMQHDSVYHFECLKGDSVLVKDYIYKYIYKPKIEYRDSIIYKDRVKNVTKEVKVEKNLAWWQKVLVYMGGLCMVLLGLIIYNKVKH